MNSLLTNVWDKFQISEKKAAVARVDSLYGLQRKMEGEREEWGKLSLQHRYLSLIFAAQWTLIKSIGVCTFILENMIVKEMENVLENSFNWY